MNREAQSPKPMTNLKKRQPRHQRRAVPKRMVLTDRDVAVVEAVFRGGALTQKQIELLFFSSPDTAGYRLERLHDNGFLARKFLFVQPGEGRSPTFYMMDRKGMELLREAKGHERKWYPTSLDVSDSYLRHCQIINNVWAAVGAASRTLGFTVEHWYTEREIKASYDHVGIRTARNELKSVAVVPDSVFSVIAYNYRFWFALEADRGSEVGSTWRDKVRAYNAWMDSGKFEARYHDKRLRVITVVRTRYSGLKRLANLKQVTEDEGGAKRFWFAPFEGIDLSRPESVFEDYVWQIATEDQPDRLLKPPIPRVNP